MVKAPYKGVTCVYMYIHVCVYGVIHQRASRLYIRSLTMAHMTGWLQPQLQPELSFSGARPLFEAAASCVPGLLEEPSQFGPVPPADVTLGGPFWESVQ